MDIPNSCNCKICQTMCEKTPCIPTPKDVKKLVKAGYKDKLDIAYWGVGMLIGIHNYPITIIAPNKKSNGHCVFYSNGLCELHDKKLKPLEGKLANCSDLPAKTIEEVKEKPLFKIIEQWEKLNISQINNLLK